MSDEKKPKKAATYEDLVALPPQYVGEIVGGELFASPRPAARHSLAASVLGAELGTAFMRAKGGPGGWWILDEPELHFGPDVMVPDLAGWRRERMPQVPDVPYFKLAPDWICEVLSPSTARVDLTLKLPRYAKAGVGHAWIVDPPNRLLEIFRQEHERWTLISAHADDALIRAEPFEAFELELGALWIAESPTVT